MVAALTVPSSAKAALRERDLAHPGSPPDEWRVRVDLAASYRLTRLMGWDDLIWTHITARVPDGKGHLLINPFGLMFDEVTASNLVKIDAEGEIIGDETGLGYNKAGFVIHSAVHEARPQVVSVAHLHPVAGVAVSSQEGGLLPLNQQSIALDVAYHEFEGLALDLDERVRLKQDLGNRDLMMLRSHGLLACGHSVANAFFNIYEFARACEIQIAAQAGGGRLVMPSQAVQDRLRQQVLPPWDVAGLNERLAWPALLRKLDKLDPSYKD